MIPSPAGAIVDSTGPAPTRLAASILLIRSRNETLEVFIQHRAITMDFAAGMVVFPGGRVDAADQLMVSMEPPSDQVVDFHATAWRHTSLAENGADATKVQASVMLAAAQRELFEETGCRLEAEELLPWANWVTPPRRPKRFDTFFYVAFPGQEQTPRHQTTEAASSVWMPVSGLLHAHSAGELELMRPTLTLLKQLDELGSIAAIVDLTTPIMPVHPE